MKDRRTTSPFLPLRLSGHSVTFPSQADEALNRVRAVPAFPAVPTSNVLASALDRLAEVAWPGRPMAGHLTYTADSGVTITIPVSVDVERLLVQAVHGVVEEVGDARAVAAWRSARVAGNVHSIHPGSQPGLRSVDFEGSAS